MQLAAAPHQLAKDGGRGLCVAERGMSRFELQLELRDETRKPRGLASGQLEDAPRQRGRVDDRVLERCAQPPTDEPRVKRVMAVLDEHCTASELQEGEACVPELRRADEHVLGDVVALHRVRVEWRPAVDERVEERERVCEGEALSADLDDQERPVTGGLDVERDEMSLGQRRRFVDVGRVDGELFPGDRFPVARLE